MNLRKLAAYSLLGLASFAANTLLFMKPFEAVYINFIASVFPVLAAFFSGYYLRFLESEIE